MFILEMEKNINILFVNMTFLAIVQILAVT